MTYVLDLARREASGWRVYPLAAYYLMATNVALTVAGIGVLQVIAGTALNHYAVWAAEESEPMVSLFGLVLVGEANSLPGVFAGFLGVWGLSLFVFGIVAYVGFWANRVYGQAVANQGT